MKKTMNFLPAFVLLPLMALSAFALTACQPKGGGTSSPSPSPQSPTGPTLEGTISGGGGNGCGGRVVETYARPIEGLNEYRLYVQPTLRVMSRSGDPLAAYLKWVAKEKTWFFVPCELQRLSTEQTGLAFMQGNDQLALHGENGIFIDQKKYEMKSSRDRATLLLHEMVMGARWLMKKSPEEQCRVLTTTDSRLCSDPEVMAIARASFPGALPAPSPGTGREAHSSSATATRIRMDADDHDAIRALTTFLVARGRGLVAEELRQTRRRLGFHFPWDEAASNLSSDDVIRAINRVRLRGTPFQLAYPEPRAQHPIFRGQAAQCAILPWSPQPGNHWVRFQFALGLDGSRSESFDEIRRLFPNTSENPSGVCEEVMTQPMNFDSSRPCAKTRLTVPSSDQNIALVDGQFEARGAVRNGRLVDEVLVMPDLEREAHLRQTGARLNQVRLLISREAEPQILTIRFEPKRVMMGAGSLPTLSPSGNVGDPNEPFELIDDQQIPAYECQPVRP